MSVGIMSSWVKLKIKEYKAYDYKYWSVTEIPIKAKIVKFDRSFNRFHKKDNTLDLNRKYYKIKLPYSMICNTTLPAKNPTFPIVE